MVKRYYGGVISATQAVANASSATGLFNITQEMQAVQAGTWPLPPPLQNTAAWFGGGSPGSGPTATVARITFATDTATASVRGPLSLSRQNLAAASNLTDGWFGAGYVNPPFSVKSTVDRITYATDTATATARGPLSLARYDLAAAGNTTDGWFGGGLPSGNVSTVNRITYATDTVTASVRGPLSAAIRYLAAAGGIQ